MNNNYIKKCNNLINNYYELLSYSNKYKNNNNNQLISIYKNIDLFNINKNIKSYTEFKKSITNIIKEILELKNTIISGDYIFKSLINNEKKINFLTLDICFYNISKKILNNNICKIIKILSKNYKINCLYNKKNILIKTNIDYNIKIKLNKYKSIVSIIKEQNTFNKFIYDGNDVYTNSDGHNLIIKKFNNIKINKYDLIKYKNFINKYKIIASSFNDYIDIKSIYSNKLIKNNLIFNNNCIDKILKQKKYIKITSSKNYAFFKKIKKKSESKEKKLLNIIKNDSLEKMKELIIKEKNIINYRFNILNLIHLVCRFNAKNILNFLLNIDNKIINDQDNLYNINPIFISIICNNFDIFKILFNNKLLNKNIKWIIGNKTKNIYNILDLCIVLDRINYVKFLINKKIDVKIESYYKCIQYNNYNILKILNIKDINILSKINKNKMSILSTSIKKLNNNVEQRKIIIYLIENGIKLEYENNIQPLNQIVEFNDIPLLNFFIKNNVNINCLDNKNMNCLDIVNKQRNELLTIIFNEKENINFDIWQNKMVKKYTFLIKEFYEFNKNKINKCINIDKIKKKLKKLKEIEDLIIISNGKYNNKIKFFNKKKEKNIFVNIDINIENDILDLCENIYKKNLLNIRKFINNRSDILYYNIKLFYTKKNIFYLIVESNLNNIFEDLLNLIIKQCNDGFYYKLIINKNLKNIYKIKYNNKFVNKNSYLIYCFLINDILLSKKYNYNLIEWCILNKSYECIDFLLNKKNLIPKDLIYKYLYNLNNLFLTIEYNLYGLFIMIFEQIKENISNKEKKYILFKIIKKKNIKILHYINTEYDNFFNLEATDNNDNNLFHYLFEDKNEDIEYIFKYLFNKIPKLFYKINKYDISPLNKLTNNNNIDLLKKIIDNGINLCDYDYLGYNIFHYSIINSNNKFINFLIEEYNYLCNIETKYDNIYPIMLCIIKNNKRIFDKLLKKYKITKTDIYGNNIYHYISIYSRLNFTNKYNLNQILNKFNILPNDYAFYKLLNSLYISKNLEESLNFYNHINPKKYNKIKLLNKKKINKLIKYYITDKKNPIYILKND